MKSIPKALIAILVASLCAPALAGSGGGHGQALAIGQNPKLLQMTRDSNAGAGNGGEFNAIRGGFSVVGCSAHNITGCFSTTYVEIDPGNAGANNQSPECDLFGCVFDPN